MPGDVPGKVGLMEPIDRDQEHVMRRVLFCARRLRCEDHAGQSERGEQREDAESESGHIASPPCSPGESGASSGDRSKLEASGYRASLAVLRPGYGSETATGTLSRADRPRHHGWIR